MSSATRRSSGRRWALGAGLVILVLLVLAGSFLAWHPALLLRAGLRLAARDEIKFDDLRVGLRELELTGVEIGDPPGYRVAELRIRYQPRLLVRGQLEEVALDGLRLRGALDERGLHLSGLGGASAEPGNEAQLPALPLPQRVSLRDARLELSTPFGALSVPFAGETHPEQDRTVFALDVDRAQLAAATGQLSGTLHLEGAVPFELQRIVAAPRDIGTRLTASGGVDLSAQALSLPGLAEGIDGQGKLAFVWQHGRLDASLANLRLGLEQIAPEWSALAALLPPPWSIELQQPAGVGASFLADKTIVEGNGRLTLASAGPRLKAGVSAALTLGSDAGLRELVVPDGEIEVHDLRFSGMRVENGSIRIDGAGTPDSWQGALRLKLSAAGQPWPGLAVDGAAAETSLDATFADHRLSMVAREPGMLQIQKLAWTDKVRIEGLGLRLNAGAEPLLIADLTDGSVAWQQHLTAEVPAFGATIGAGATASRLDGQIKALTAELRGEGAALSGGRIALVGGAVGSPVQGLRLSGIAGELALSGTALDPNRPIPVSIASIAHEGKPAWFAPWRLQGRVQPQGEQIAFDVNVARAPGGVDLHMVGQHDLASGQGRAQVELPPVDFAPGGLQPGTLSPLVADLVEDVSGRLAMDGSVRWGAGPGVGADLDLLVENLAFSSGPARFEQVNGVIAFDRLVPLSTPSGQQLAVGLADLGLPLTDGLLTFQLEPGRLAVEGLRGRFAQGRIQAAPFTIGSGEMRFATTLTAERLNLDEIFTLTQLDGLTGKGTMHGTLPITVDGANALIEGGELVSDGPGWVRYRPAQAPAALQAGGENVNLLLQALENFHYKELRLTVDGHTDAEMDVGLHIAGANPELYDGYPIEFNLNLEGALGNLLRSSLAGYQIPDRIRKQMQGFGR